ncbi:Portal protein [uncultured Caudovirales phage]|uniref:Portal protein n=1 Tax=uncultured Caudovirales phage TaxID=2100421 RepID=A0A6J5MZX0_9CAUD|nr:Portal protein [uncultured Caudovirales phage]
MARSSQTEQLASYRQHIETSKKWRKDDGHDALWKRLIDLYKGKHYDHFSNEDRMLINISFSIINVIAPAVAVNYPKITVNAQKPENAPHAVVAEAVVNYWWKYMAVREEFRRAVKDLLIVGHGWIKTGYRFVEEGAISESGESDYSDPITGGESTAVSVITQDAPFAERVSPFDVFIDADSTNMHDAKWIAQRIRRPIKEVNTDKRYNKVAREEVQVMAVSRYSDDPSQRKVYDKNYGYAEIWEYYDIRSKTMCVFAEGGKSFLVKPQKMPYAFGHPFVMLRNYDVPDSFYPIGDLEQIEPLQKELNETRSQMMNHRKRFSRKYLYKESAFDQFGRTALESDDDNVMVPVVSDEPLPNVVSAFPTTMSPPEFYSQSDLIENDINRITGLPEFMSGGIPEIRRTATEISAVQDAANARTADKLAIVETSISAVAKRMLMLAQQFMTGKQVTRIVGKDGEPFWVEYDRTYLEGEFDFEVVGGSTQPHNEAARRQMALQMVDAIAPFAGSGIINMPELASYVLQFGFNVKNPEKFVQAPPPPAPAAGGPPPEGGQPPQGGMPPDINALMQGQPTA